MSSEDSKSAFPISVGKYKTLHLMYFHDIQNGPAIAREGRDKVQCAFINPTLILDSFQLLIAAGKASNDAANNKLKTKSIYQEVAFNLSPSGHIPSSLERYCYTTGSKVLAAVFDADQAKLDEIRQYVQGKEVDLSQLATDCDVEGLKKQYKIAPVELNILPQSAHKNLVDAVVHRIALKGSE